MAPRHIVLIGGGHAHVQVLRRWIMRPPHDAVATLVVDRAVAVYSGMVPAWVAGEVPRHALEIDVRPLARRAGVSIVVGAVHAVDAQAQRVHIAGRGSLPYDVASLDVGSTVAALDVPGVVDHAIPTRPIGAFLDRLEGDLVRLADRTEVDLVVVGAGAGGVEIATCLSARLRRDGKTVCCTLLSAAPDVLPGAAPSVVAKVRQAVEARQIQVRTNARVASVERDAVRFEDGSTLRADMVVWVTGAVAHAWVAASGLPTDPRGFVQVRDTLQVVGHDTLLAAGDTAFFVNHPWVPRAGVYAVRQGPLLVDNLDAWLRGARLSEYKPQSDFLSMLNLGDGTATVAKWGMALHGAWVWRWKMRVDTRFMEAFQVLTPEGGRDTPFGRMMPEMSEDMVCGGCAAKIDATTLDAVLGDGPTPRDDAARVSVGGGQVVASVDGFPPFTDDPWLVGRLAVVHALNDLYAKGVAPRSVLLTLAVPDHAAPHVLEALLAGARASVEAEGVTLIGGHTATGMSMFVGVTVLGDGAGPWWSNAGAQVGDRVVVTGPLGAGVLWRADGLGRARGPWIDALVATSARGDREAAEVARGFDVHAATDITGFGLAGHLANIARASGVSIELDPRRVPLFDGVRELLSMGLRSTAHAPNEASCPIPGAVDPTLDAVVHDPQTAGPLALLVSATDAPGLVASLVERGYRAAVVGRVLPGEDGVAVRLGRGDA